REVFLPLTSGASICLPETAEIPEPPVLFEWLKRERISIVHSVRSLAEFWLNHLPSDVVVPSVRCVFFVGEPLTDTTIDRVRRVVSPSSEIVNLYGTTETGPAKC